MEGKFEPETPYDEVFCLFFMNGMLSTISWVMLEDDKDQIFPSCIKKGFSKLSVTQHFDVLKNHLENNPSERIEMSTIIAHANAMYHLFCID